MDINTKYFGEISVAEDEQITFPSGLFGFENNKKFFLLSFDERNEDMVCLQSVDEPVLGFVLINPFCVYPEYEPLMLTGEDLKELESTPEEPLVFYAIAVVHEDMGKSTINLKCPVVINPRKRIGKQVIFDGEEYSMRYPLSCTEVSATEAESEGGVC